MRRSWSERSVGYAIRPAAAAHTAEDCLPAPPGTVRVLVCDNALCVIRMLKGKAMATRIPRLFVVLAVAASSVQVIPVAAEPLRLAPRPHEWMLVSSPDGAGITLHASPGGEVVAEWSDGAVMGVLGQQVAEGAGVWILIQDPVTAEGWVVLDRLAEMPTPVTSNPNEDQGGVQPIASDEGLRTCPPGFPIKGAIEGRGGYLRLAYLPEQRSYGQVAARACFRTPDEAAAWQYDLRPVR